MIFISDIFIIMEIAVSCKIQKIQFPEKNGKNVRSNERSSSSTYNVDAMRKIACNIDPSYIAGSPMENSFLLNLKKRMDVY
jgi:hypothetical protein